MSVTICCGSSPRLGLTGAGRPAVVQGVAGQESQRPHTRSLKCWNRATPARRPEWQLRPSRPSLVSIEIFACEALLVIVTKRTSQLKEARRKTTPTVLKSNLRLQLAIFYGYHIQEGLGD